MMGGLSREREISLKTGKAILKALIEKGPTGFILRKEGQRSTVERFV